MQSERKSGGSGLKILVLVEIGSLLMVKRIADSSRPIGRCAAANGSIEAAVTHGCRGGRHRHSSRSVRNRCRGRVVHTSESTTQSAGYDLSARKGVTHRQHGL